MKSNVATLPIAAACVCVPAGAMAEERDQICTVLGPVASGCANFIRHTDWCGLFTGTKMLSSGEASA